MPQRIQRKRTAGWRMPDGVVYVGRPTKWGNDWTAQKYWDAGYSGSEAVAIQHCVEAYRAWLEGREHWAHGIPLRPVPDLTSLRGKDLACWCALDSPCHADVLLEREIMKSTPFDFRYSLPKPPTLIRESERTIVCVDCGVSVQTKARRRKRCDPCRVTHDVKKTAQSNRKKQAKLRAARMSSAPQSGSKAD